MTTTAVAAGSSRPGRDGAGHFSGQVQLRRQIGESVHAGRRREARRDGAGAAVGAGVGLAGAARVGPHCVCAGARGRFGRPPSQAAGRVPLRGSRRPRRLIPAVAAALAGSRAALLSVLTSRRGRGARPGRRGRLQGGRGQGRPWPCAGAAPRRGAVPRPALWAACPCASDGALLRRRGRWRGRLAGERRRRRCGARLGLSLGPGGGGGRPQGLGKPAGGGSLLAHALPALCRREAFRAQAATALLLVWRLLAGLRGALGLAERAGVGRRGKVRVRPLAVSGSLHGAARVARGGDGGRER
mmetsp:Transcript_19344/g.74199  ORF Transcript_19344/g.74199 Transcript_19344/m.74199 type:complete len:300 (+) Transcript_19344:1852-2751(+)